MGLGYVGLPLAVAFAGEGCDVVGVDLDARKIEAIAAGESYVEDVPSDSLHALAGRIHASTRYAPLEGAEAVLMAARAQGRLHRLSVFPVVCPRIPEPSAHFLFEFSPPT